MANVGPFPRFEDFDDPSVYKHCEAAIMKADILNMVIEFDSTKAQAALDVKSLEMEKILHSKVRNSLT